MKNKTKKAPTLSGMGSIPGEEGTTFRVWAPFAEKVSVIGTFNDWDEATHPLDEEEDGYWATHVAAAKPGDEYKYAITNGDEVFQRLDPYARQVTNSVGNSIIHSADFDWGDTADFKMPPFNELIIYEMHIGTFHIDEEKENRGTFESAIEKLPYLQELGVNAIEIMPPMEFPGGISWGYNPALPFAIESDYGGPAGFKSFVKAAHEHGIGVILDVVYNHFGPSDLDLWRFDGWYEHEGGGIYFYNDEKAATPWGDTRPDYGRSAVRQYIRDNAMMWLTEYHVDGLRWDATAYIRNVNGNDVNNTQELADGWSLMQWVNEEMNAHAPQKISIAEDLSNNEWLVKDTGAGGAGFGSQWDSEFVHSIRQLIITNDDEFRNMESVVSALQHQYNGDVFKRVVYTESHDEVANGKARVPEEIWPENSLSWFSKKRSTLGAALVFTAPGIPMIFQGQEFLEDKWFQDTEPLDWSRAKQQEGMVTLYRDLITLRRNLNGRSRGLTGSHIDIYHVNQEAKLIAFHRWNEGGPGDSVVVVLNFTSETRTDYRIGFPATGVWKLRFDSHAHIYDESYDGQVSQDVEADGDGADGQSAGGQIAIAPYSALIFSQD